ncbi:MAG: cell surface protein SprA [Chlorobiaceae bacterium]|nr:cell surface protein SprA [Chlorobiaceae bacterium]MBA4308898.1 cell surface protein SprA [Chlorobiaceae bacterium]
MVQKFISLAALFFCIVAVFFSFGFVEKNRSDFNPLLWFDAYFNLKNNSLSADSFTQNQTQLNNQNNFSNTNSVNESTTFLLNDFLQNSDSIFVDSLQLANSDTTALDTLPKVDPRTLDSTARLEQFKFQREATHASTVAIPRSSAFFAEPTQATKRREVNIDSTGNYVEVKEFVGGVPFRLPIKIPIDEYLKLKLQSREEQLWDELVYKYEIKDTAKKELGQLIRDITDLEIPLPSVGILSIFGTPKINLRISGAVDIHGAWKNETTEGITASRLGNTRNEPDFRQQVQINLSGTIGDKLQINADWNTERTFEYENQLKIQYRGYDDEIIQNIEAGNVSMQTSPLIGGGEALFGIKAEFQLGPFSLTTIASQKKGETKEKTVTGGSTSQEFSIRAFQYSNNHYFIDSIFADTSAQLNLFYKYYGSPTPIVEQFFKVNEIEVWKSINQITQNPNERNAIAYISLPPRPPQGYGPELRAENIQEAPGRIAKGRFIRLTQGVDYTLNAETGFISFRSNILEQEIIAVSYRLQGATPATNDDVIRGEFLNQTQLDTLQRLILKLVKPANLQPQMREAWNLKLRNIYPIGGRNIKKEGFEFDIRYDLPGQDPVNVLGNVRLLNAFGLDLVDQGNNPTPDNIFDFRTGVTILPETGEIIFPVLQPFGRNLPGALRSVTSPPFDSLRYNDVYDTSVVFAQQNNIRNKWILTGKFSGDATSTYQLGFNLVENSVRVILNGRELTSGVDYFVDYSIGQLTIRNEAALVPGANLKITYEENDLFQLASKTLFGARGIFDISEKTKLGFTALTLTQQTLSDKVRIGEEPLSNSIYGIDFQTGADLPFVTRALDQVISTREMSSFNLRGEFAYMRPDPNTKKSTIASDGGKSIAYIDDFEGAKRIIPVGINYTTWRDLSIPNKIDSIARFSVPPDSLQRIMNYKGKAYWFNVLPSDVDVKEIWPEKQVGRGDQNITVLDFVFSPGLRGTFNYNPQLQDRRQAWGGMMKPLSSTANNLVEENIEFIEVWVQNLSVERAPKLFIDIGKISEDVIPNNRLDTEDKNFNELIDEGEDVGLDGIPDQNEGALLPTGVSYPDPSGDNFSFNLGTGTIDSYQSINGTEGNAQSIDIGRFPDTEDLNRNGTLDQLNSFFRYEITMDSDTANNPYIAGGGTNGWYLYRIPLKDFSDVFGAPSFSVIESIRLFVAQADTNVHLRMTEFNLVGNQWQKGIKDDSVLAISVVNIEDNSNIYTIPPGISREKDRSRPDENILRNEQSLNLELYELPFGQSREAIKYLLRPLDVFNYTEMKMFIRADDNTRGTDFFFRFGTDTNNYYEYLSELNFEDGNGVNNWSEISIEFAKITALKQERDSVNQIVVDSIFVNGSYFVYRIKGSPSLTGIRFLSVGVTNLKDATFRNPVTGQVWVNELRVVGADDTPGWAYTVSSQIKFADLLTLNLNMNRTDPFFHGLAERFGSRVDAQAWNIAVDFDVLKLLPFNLPNSNLKINYSKTENLSKPLYLPGTDIKVEEAAGKLDDPQRLISETETFTTSESWTISNIRLPIPSSKWYFRDTWNALTFSFNHNKQYQRSPTIQESRGWIWNALVNYNISLSNDYFIEPLDLPGIGVIFAFLKDYSRTRIYFTPQTISASLSTRRQRAFNTTRAQQNIQSTSTVSRDFTMSRDFSLNWRVTENALLNLALTYNFNSSSSLTYLETDIDEQQRSESEIWRDIFGGRFFGRENQYSQNLDIRTSPRLPSLWDISNYFSLQAGYNVRYQWSNDFRQVELGRGAGFNNRITVGMRLRWQALTAPLFAEAPANPKEPFRDDRFNNNFVQQQLLNDTTNTAFADSLLNLDTLQVDRGPSTISRAFSFLKLVSKVLLFDYDNISIDFSNDNTVQSTGIAAFESGFKNFWGIQSNDSKGPSRLFMLGLSQNVGLRAKNGNLSDNFSQRNSFEIRTARPLWEGAKIDLTWKVGWSMNKNTPLLSDSLGNIILQPISATGTLDRSFFTVPPFFLFSMFQSGIKQVNELYNPRAPNPDQSLSDAFSQGFESLPIFSTISFLKEFAKFVPRPNWRITWDGLEKISIFESFTQRVSLDHGYSANYAEGWRLDTDGKQVTQSQKISYGFQPLIGMNIVFKQLWEGNLTGSVKYNTRTNFDLAVTTRNITETFSREIGVTIGFNKTGFELPLFGVSLKNDFEFSFSYSNTKNSTILYQMENFNEEGTPQDGTTRTTLEPRVKYVISSKVTLSIFYKRSSVAPEGATRIPPSTTNEGGLDIRITIN